MRRLRYPVTKAAIVMLCAIMLSIWAGCDPTDTGKRSEEPLLKRHAELPELRFVTGSLAFSPDGKTLATGAGVSASWRERSEITLWDVAMLTRRSTWLEKGGRVEQLAYTPDGTRLASRDYGVDLWEVKTGKRVFSNLARGGVADALAVSPDGKLLATASTTWGSDNFVGSISELSQAVAGKRRGLPERSKVVISDATTGKVILTLEEGIERFTELAFSPDGKTLVVAGVNTSVRLLDVVTWRERSAVFMGSAGTPRFSPDGKRIYLTRGHAGALYNVHDGSVSVELDGHQDDVLDAAFSPDAKILATASEALKLWNTQTGELIHIWKPLPFSDYPTNWVNAVVFSPDGQLLVTATGDGEVALWDVLR